MDDKQRRRFTRGEQVRDFTVSVTNSFPKDSKGAASIARITQLVEQITALDASRETNRREAKAGTSGKREARDALRNIINAISRTARAIGMDDPEMRDKFRAPATRTNYQTLISTARSFLTEATPRKAQFIAYGMKADFLEDLDAKIKAFESHTEQQHTSGGARAADRAAIKAALDELDAEIERFDVIMLNTFAGDARTLAAWKTAHHTERDEQKRKNGKAPQPTPPK